MAQVVLHLDNTMGAAFVGIIVSATLHGVTAVQGWYYFTHQKDHWYLVLLVAAVLLFETVHQALISHTVYTYLITNFDNPLMLGSLVWSLLVEVLFNGLTALLVQSFWTIRVWRLSNRNIWLTGSVASLVLAEFTCVVVYTAQSVRMTTYVQLATLKTLSITVNALAVAGDVLIAGSLCFLLYHSRTGFHGSDAMIKKLMVFSVNTGVLTSLCAIASLISILAAPNTFLYIAFYFSLGRLYSNSLLATLNARKSIRNAADVINTTSDRMSISLRDLPKSPISSKRVTNNISVRIDTTKERTDDHDLTKPPSLPYSGAV